MEGPLEIVVLTFPGSDVHSSVVGAFDFVRSQSSIRIVDLLFVTRTATGQARTRELDELTREEAARLHVLEPDGHEPIALGWLSMDDIEEITAGVGPDETAVAVLFEHTWAAELRQEVRKAGGAVAVDARIPNERVAVIESLITSGDPDGRYAGGPTTLRRAAVVRRRGLGVLAPAVHIVAAHGDTPPGA